METSNDSPIIKFYPTKLDYDKGVALQMEFHKQVVNHQIPWALMGLEHSPVISLGKRGAPESDILVPKDEAKRKGYSVIVSDRGGQATLHQPGQLVIYPIFPIQRLGVGVKAYVDLLLETTKATLDLYKIPTQYNDGSPGLFTLNGKIAFVGIRVEKGVARHGVSINVTNQLDDFALIAACGVIDASLDKVEYYTDVDCKKVFTDWQHIFLERIKELT
jgi:lipoyl(octanoyl) transferase